MAADLELEPKPYHVIAFEDTNDCKNLGYIIQAQMDMFGNGHAFVVAQPPKDVFREAKANGFGVTVIRKGEVQLNVGQTLEEVEEHITEIGSKIYHDKIMQERSMDISSLMKGVFGFSGKPTKRTRSKQTMKTAIGFSGKPTKRKRSKQTLKKPSKKESLSHPRLEVDCSSASSQFPACVRLLKIGFVVYHNRLQLLTMVTFSGKPDKTN
ncbi:uncharacterized protein Pyn_07420 [Prunus yedoensis var. nudiflora]|uniref:Uncharacterized protein n=1 Tax=Prunus yedoensis var. nudiflora TaxID=2094558 RepID=A0A314UC85_PRUYE|nr:uncharacterized protein Pyn_07420 [Prunus yedoensis var. nudiflora]